MNESTGYSPYFIMFGREARLAVDVTFWVSSDGTSTKSYLRYVKNMKRELQAAYQLAGRMAEKKNEGNKQRYDQRVCFCPLDSGDRVLIWNLGLQGKHKLADRWKDTSTAWFACVQTEVWEWTWLSKDTAPQSHSADQTGSTAAVWDEQGAPEIKESQQPAQSKEKRELWCSLLTSAWTG